MQGALKILKEDNFIMVLPANPEPGGDISETGFNKIRPPTDNHTGQDQRITKVEERDTTGIYPAVSYFHLIGFIVRISFL